MAESSLSSLSSQSADRRISVRSTCRRPKPVHCTALAQLSAENSDSATELVFSWPSRRCHHSRHKVQIGASPPPRAVVGLNPCTAPPWRNSRRRTQILRPNLFFHGRIVAVITRVDKCRSAHLRVHSTCRRPKPVHCTALAQLSAENS